MVTALIRTFTRRRPGALMDVTVHLFHATTLGTLFLALLILSQTPVLFHLTVGYGVVYSIVLWIISPYLTRGVFESTGDFRMTMKGLTTSFLAHIIYGVSLGLLIPIFM